MIIYLIIENLCNLLLIQINVMLENLSSSWVFIKEAKKMKLIYFISILFEMNLFVYGFFEDGNFFNFGSRNRRSNQTLMMCDENKLLLHLANLQILSPERIILQLSFVHPADICK